MFLVQYQNSLQTEKTLDLLEHNIMIDTNYRITNTEVSAASRESSMISKSGEHENLQSKKAAETNSV